MLARGSAATAEMDCYEALNEQQVDLAQQLKALVAEEVQVGRWHAHGDCCGWVAPGGVVRRGIFFFRVGLVVAKRHVTVLHRM